MTVAEFLENNQRLSAFKGRNGRSLQDRMLETNHIWDNRTCSSYCALAMATAGFSEEETTRVLEALEQCYETVPFDHAEMLGMSAFMDMDD